jgi:hypothetical protein
VWEAWQDNFNFCDPISIFYLSIQSFNALQKKKKCQKGFIATLKLQNFWPGKQTQNRHSSYRGVCYKSNHKTAHPQRLQLRVAPIKVFKITLIIQEVEIFLSLDPCASQ